MVQPEEPPVQRAARAHTTTDTAGLAVLAKRRSTLALALSAAVVVIYFGFILLVAFAKAWMGALVAPGLSRGILLGALVIVAAWALTWIYVRWANTYYDGAVRALRRRE